MREGIEGSSEPTRITDYEITEEGEEALLNFLSSQPKEGSRAWLKSVALRSVRDGGTYRDFYGAVVKTIPSLERLGLIRRISTSSESLLEDIDNLEMRKDLGTYYRLAKGLEVSDNEVDELYSRIKSALSRLKRNRPYGALFTEGGGFKEAKKLVDEAESRRDKVIAIDASMSLYHDLGGPPTMGFWKIDYEEDPNSLRAERLLTRLFEE